MKKRCLISMTLLAGFWFTSSATFAMQHDDCGTEMSPEEAALGWLQHVDGQYEVGVRPENTVFVPLTFHVVRTGAGTGGLPPDRLDIALEDANLAFAGANIQFCVPGPIDYIDSDFFYYNIRSVGDVNQLRQTNVVPNTINCYFTENLPWCGISSFTFSSVQGIVMNNACTALPTNHSTFPHEIGHYFDLFHTHETAYGRECVNRTNCSTAGDLLCDTEADPNVLSQVSSSCVYTGSASPPCAGDPPYDPPVTNLMSYSTKPCRDHFTQGQLDRSYATLTNLRPNLVNACGSPYQLSMDVLRAGQAASASVEGATPNTTQYLIYSTRGLGSTSVPVLGVVLDLDRPVLLSQVQSDGSGNATFGPQVVGSGLAGRTLWFQVAENQAVTNVEERTVQN